MTGWKTGGGGREEGEGRQGQGIVCLRRSAAAGGPLTMGETLQRTPDL